MDLPQTPTVSTPPPRIPEQLTNPSQNPTTHNTKNNTKHPPRRPNSAHTPHLRALPIPRPHRNSHPNRPLEDLPDAARLDPCTPRRRGGGCGRAELVDWREQGWRRRECRVEGLGEGQLSAGAGRRVGCGLVCDGLIGVLVWYVCDGEEGVVCAFLAASGSLPGCETDSRPRNSVLSPAWVLIYYFCYGGWQMSGHKMGTQLLTSLQWSLGLEQAW